MPGIFGIVDPYKKFPLPSLMKRMQKAMLHEPWYVSRFYCSEKAGLGIVDLGKTSSRHQPVFLRNGQVFGVLDGRVYQEKDESRGFRFNNDAEYVLHFLKQKGKRCINQVNGSFVGATWDATKNELTLFNDRFGFIPLYYAQCDDIFVFASELKALLLMPFVTGELDDRAVADFFTFGFMLNDETYFTKIKRLPAASWLEFKDGTLKWHTYWEPQYKIKQTKSTQECVEEFEELFNRAVARCCGKYVRIGALLSSGLDSRLIAAVLNAQGRLHHTFTMADGNSLERVYALQVSNKLAGKHHGIIVRPRDFIKNAAEAVWRTEGMVSVFHIPIIALKDVLRQNVDVVFDGIQMLDGFYSHWETKIPPWLYSKKVKGLSLQSRIFNLPVTKNIHFWEHLFKKEFLANLDGGLLGALNQMEFLPNGKFSSVWDQLDYWSLVYRKRRFIALGPQLLRNWVEVNMPFFDYDVMNFIFSLPPHLRDHGRLLLRRALCRWAPELAEIPACPDLLPVKFYGIKRDIRRFGSYALKSVQKLFNNKPNPLHSETLCFGRWLRESSELQKFVLANLFSESKGISQIFEMNEVLRLVKEHFLAKANHTEMIGRFLTFVLWSRQLTDMKSMEPFHEISMRAQ